MIFIVVIGGIGTIEGPIIGTIVFFTLQQKLSQYGAWYLIILGCVAVLAAVWLRGGVWGTSPADSTSGSSLSSVASGWSRQSGRSTERYLSALPRSTPSTRRSHSALKRAWCLLGGCGTCVSSHRTGASLRFVRAWRLCTPLQQ